ncbi:FAST kinase domain-containing protein 1, mitochondrial-like [Antedon mediterranea]|uniref:FAST kinase domain-containing protein 1, mitochondrial-like n=1 Tax=Antedon mediterranea TaxID=105859 RepID=UPI003AF5029E
MVSLLGRRCSQMIKDCVYSNKWSTLYASLKTQRNCKYIQRNSYHVSCKKSSSSRRPDLSETLQRPLTTNEAVLLREIELKNDVDSLFELLKSKRSLLTTAHIGAAMINLVKQQKSVDDSNAVIEIRNYIRFHPEFHSLCILAENKVWDMDNNTLVNTLYGLLKFVLHHSNSLVAEMITEVHRRLSSFNVNELAKFAACSEDALNLSSVLLGNVTDCFHKFIEKESMDVRDVSTLFRATVTLTSYGFRQQIYKLLLKMLEENKDTVTTNDLRKILQGIAIRKDNPRLLIQKCISLLEPHIKSLSIWELTSIYHSLEGHEDGLQLRTDITKCIQNFLPTLNNPSNLVRVMSVLAQNASPELKFTLEALADQVISEIPHNQLGDLCSALRVMGFRVPCHLTTEIARSYQSSSNFQYKNLLKIVEFFHSTHLPHNNSFFEFLETKVLDFYKKAFSPIRFLGITYLLSLLPISNLEPKIIDKLERMLPQYSVASISQLFLSLSRISKKLDKESNERIGLNSLLQKLNMQAVEKIIDVKSVVYLNNMINHMLEGETNSALISTIMSQYTNCLHKLTPNLAVECARNVTRTRFLQIPLLEAIADITSQNMSRVTPRQVLSLLSPYCILNYRPQNTPDFFHICLRRFMPFLDHLPSVMILDMAFLLSLVEEFPEKLLHKLFNLQFLIKLEEEVYASPRSRMYCQRLMHLNRAVVIECNHLQIPWFHEDYCLEILKTRKSYLPAVLKSLQSCLSQILGGPQYFRSFVLSPYFYDIDFECVLDRGGKPLPCADYGSVLNRSGQVISTMLSDLMQWGTQTKQVPQGAQRIAIDFLSKSQFCLNSHHTSGLVAAKKRHLEVMGYKYIQIPYYVWDRLTLSEHHNELSYMQDLIFDNNLTSSEITQKHSLVKDDQKGSIIRNSEEHTMVLRFLNLLDRINR